MSRKLLLIVSIICAFALFINSCSLVQTAQEFSKTGNDFMTALKEGNYQAGYDLFAAELQAEVGEVSDLEKMMKDNNAQPQEWSFASWNLSTDANQNNTANVEGTVTYQDGRKGAVTLELIKLDNIWKIISFNLTW